MEIRKYQNNYFEDTAYLLSLFRVHLKSFKEIKDEPNLSSAKDELSSFLKDENYPIYLCLNNNQVVGYMILRIDGVVWVEQIYVKEEERRKGVASLLFQKAESISNQLGSDTLFNYVHPNNHAMINFLKNHGYTVLNLIEIRKPFKDETLKTTINCGTHQFDY